MKKKVSRSLILIKIQHLLTGIVLTTSLLSESVHCQEEETAPHSSHKGAWFIGAGYLTMDEEEAAQQGVDDSAIVLDLGYQGAFRNGFTYGLGVYLPLIDDKAEFSQRVENTYTGQQREEESEISGWGLFAELGYRYKLNDKVSLGAAGGFRSLSADRDIPNCTDCYSEGLSLDGGAYVKPYLYIDNASFDVEIAYHAFQGGIFSGGFGVNVLFSW